MVTSSLVTALALASARTAAQGVANVSARIEALAVAQPQPPPPSVTDFTAALPSAAWPSAWPSAPLSALPSSLPSARLVGELERASSQAGVAIANLTVAEHRPSAAELGRVEISASMRGPYVGVKQVLAQVLGRFPHATLRALRMRREPMAGMVETSAVFSVWSAAQTAGPGPESAAAHEQAGR